jgi:hypothetical protein
MPSSERVEKLRRDIADLDTFMASGVFLKWCEARQVEADSFNFQISQTAQSFNEVIELRAKRDNTLEVASTFEDIRENLKTELDKQLEADNKVSAESTQ